MEQQSQTIKQTAEFQAVRNKYNGNENMYVYITFPNQQGVPVVGDYVGLVKTGETNLKECIATRIIKEGDVWVQTDKFVQVLNHLNPNNCQGPQ